MKKRLAALDIAAYGVAGFGRGDVVRAAAHMPGQRNISAGTECCGRPLLRQVKHHLAATRHLWMAPRLLLLAQPVNARHVWDIYIVQWLPYLETTLPLVVALLVISAILAVSASVDFKVRVPPVLSVLPLASNESILYKFNAPPSVK